MEKGKDNIFRIEIDSREKSAESEKFEKKLNRLGYEVEVIQTSKVYTISHSFSKDQVKKISGSLYNPVVETARVDEPLSFDFDYALETGYLPGVTDNVAGTVSEIIEDLFNLKKGICKAFSSTIIFLRSKGRKLQRDDIEKIAHELINTLIERYHIKSRKEYINDLGMDYVLPAVRLEHGSDVSDVDLEISDADLAELGKKGIVDPDTGARRGPLALSLDYLRSIRDYFRKQGRSPTDIELESIAQTWSEHCKHTIFSAGMDEIKEGIFNRYIKGATEDIRKRLGKDDFCISVFKDNSGSIVFDDEYMISDKAETHNSPSALDPFGGAITGIVGVNRDTIGFGMGALPIANKYGYCVGRPEDHDIVYRGKGMTNPSLQPKRLLDGIVHGVNSGGNCSGIPTHTGFVFFDDHYKGKPLVFVGTIGIMPRVLPNKRPAHIKKAQPGDNIVVIGGRVGKDGIHGATFSSEAMDSGSPATAVQIGDPITQKKLSDAVVKEARDRGLYNSNTDNGAGGLSCSVAEMAQECGGFIVDIEKIPLKYPGLSPWEIWISESQERMTLSVPDDKIEEFNELMESRGVESTTIGRFNDSNRGIVKLRGRTILDLDMEFLHDGLPKTTLTTEGYPYNKTLPRISWIDTEDDMHKHTGLLLRLLSSHNICSYEFISKQYDHEVQHNSVIKPLVGKGRVNSPAQVIRPLLTSTRGVVLSQVILPRLSEISCYDMAACAIDSAIRNSVAAGADIKHLALLDNFCWCSSDDRKRLGQLKDAAGGCYDFATAFMTPFISGKDSMYNDFKGFDKDDNPIKISVHPTLMISSIGVISDVNETMTFELKVPGDIIYAIGKTGDECGGSEFYNLMGEIGTKAPKVIPESARKLYITMHKAIKAGAVSSCASVGPGGLLVWLAKMAISGRLGCAADFKKIPLGCADMPLEKIFYSESQSRFIVSVEPKKKQEFEKMMEDFDASEIGEVSDDDSFTISFGDRTIIKTTVNELEESYKRRFKEF
ncbi:phosphoribosylformylglycinamidine synthase [Candidatus Woesearchaeota archaeon]|nr:phosphoribosylformylglycinamidine synthase [Candidatus Woesearchaeota archaeon]